MYLSYYERNWFVPALLWDELICSCPVMRGTDLFLSCYVEELNCFSPVMRGSDLFLFYFERNGSVLTLLWEELICFFMFLIKTGKFSSIPTALLCGQKIPTFHPVLLWGHGNVPYFHSCPVMRIENVPQLNSCIFMRVKCPIFPFLSRRPTSIRLEMKLGRLVNVFYEARISNTRPEATQNTWANFCSLQAACLKRFEPVTFAPWHSHLRQCTA